MRIPDTGEDLAGKVCVCSTGRAGVVTGQKEFAWGVAWVGLGLDGKGTWCSSNPAVVAESAEEFRQTLEDRFGGKMSYLD